MGSTWLSKKSKFLELLRVKPEEAKIVSLVFVFAFFVGIVQNILCSIPLAMFLAHYESSLLPYIYIGSGAALFVAGFAFSYLERNFTLFYVFAVPMGLFAASLLLFWGALLLVKADWIFLVLLIWSTLVCYLMMAILLLLINQMFTTQQSKRLFGLIWCGVGIGGILIGFGIDLLVQWIGANGIILLSALILLCGLLTQFSIRKNSGSRLSHTEEKEDSSSSISLNSFKNKRYILYIFFLTALFYLVIFSFDLLFKTEVQKQFPTEGEMAVFYGILFATYDIASLFTSLFFSPWVLSRFGLIASLLLWPLALVILMSVAFFANLIPLFVGAIFPILLVTAVFETVLVETMTFESILLLFQPLRPAQRSWAQIKNEAIVVPLAMAVVGAVLVGIDTYAGIQLSVMSLIIIGGSLGGVLVILWVIKKGYLNLLVESLSKRSIVNPQFTKLNKESLGVLKKHLQSSYAEEVIYVLQTIETVDQGEFEKVLLEGLDHPLDEVRRFALRKVEQYRLRTLSEKLEVICKTEKNPAVLGAALLALGSIANLEGYPWFKQYLEGSTEITRDCLVALINYGSATAKAEAIGSVVGKARSPKWEARLVAAWVFKYVEIDGKTDSLLPLLKDENLEVRLLACQVVQTADERLYGALIENLSLAHLRDSALRSLTQLGGDSLGYIAAHFADYPDGIKGELINLLGLIPLEPALKLLLELLPAANRRLRHNVLLSLKRHAYKASTPEAIAVVNGLLQSENSNIVQLQEQISILQGEKTTLLRSLLSRERELSQECCFLLLLFLYPEAAILKAQKGLLSDDADLLSNAEELLLQTLNGADQKLLMAQLSAHLEQKNSGANGEQLDSLLQQILSGAANYFIPALSAAVAYTIGSLQLKQLAPLLGQLEEKNDPLLQEIKPWALKQLGRSS